MVFDPATRYRIALPDEAALIRDEVADVVDLSPSERARLLALACRAGAQLLALHAPVERARILDTRDPLPPESQAALARLRERYRARRR